MESLFKKRSLMLSGLSKELKKKELAITRENSKNKQLSILRNISDESKIPKFGQKVTGNPSRAVMLKKWKEEKLLKQQREQQMKKPIFKVGVISKVITPTLPVLENQHSRSKTSFSQTSYVSEVSSDADTKITISSKMPAPSKEISNVRNKISVKTPQALKPASSTLKTSHISKVESGSQKLVFSTVKSASSQFKSAQTTKPTSFKSTQKAPVSTFSRTTTHIKKSAAAPQESTSSISKPVSSFLRNSQASKEVSVPFKASQKPLSFKPAFHKGAKCKETTTAPKSNVEKTAKGSLEDIIESTAEEPPEDQPSQQIFDCNISHIKPDPHIRKSFAPENFLFCAPVEIDISCFNIDGPSAIFSKAKIESGERTSTPLKETDKSSKSSTISETTSLKETLPTLTFFSFKEVDQGLKSLSIKETDQSKKSTPVKEIDQYLKYVPLKETDTGVISIPLKETDTSVTSIPLKETDTSVTSIPLKETDTSVTSIPLKETDTSVTSIPLKETDTSLTSVPLKETSPNSLAQSSVDEIDRSNDVHDIVQKQETFSKVEAMNELNISFKHFTEKEPILEALDDNDPNDINNVNSIVANSSQPETSGNEQKLSLDDSIDFDKFVAEHGDEPLDTYSTVPGDSLNLSLDEARQSRKSSSGARPKSKESVKPNLKSIMASSETKLDLSTTPKTSRKKATKDDSSFTPRRSIRLAEKFRRSSSFESLHNIQRPSIMGFVDLDEPISATASSGFAYDFDNLHLEDTPKMKRRPKVSLLYTPPTRGRPSTRKSVKGDLISFSPVP